MESRSPIQTYQTYLDTASFLTQFNLPFPEREQIKMPTHPRFYEHDRVGPVQPKFVPNPLYEAPQSIDLNQSVSTQHRGMAHLTPAIITTPVQQPVPVSISVTQSAPDPTKDGA